MGLTDIFWWQPVCIETMQPVIRRLFLFFAKRGKALERLLQYCSEETGYEQQEVEAIIGCFLDKISQELSEGHTVDLGACFGIFSVKLRTGTLQEGSPRTPKDSRYRVVFREGNHLRQRLKL